MDYIRTMVEAAAAGKPAEFQSGFDTELRNRLLEGINERRAIVVAEAFGLTPNEPETPEQ